MKKLKRMFLPVAIVLFAVGAALASHAAKSLDSSEPGYYFDSSTSQCVSAGVDCSTIPGQACTWTDESNITHNLSREGETMCGVPLYKQ
ncbi:DUF6520 family protein [uncultured Draconibacterium sp.]|uniref:DUF6520 family protein n=1 Tax=uncultured Draconibacterium sp. TaxID=1573823 RepID=UPI0029C0C1D6|nr:DUF6520 family protein [uncultured Draconibacterium sp.]